MTDVIDVIDHLPEEPSCIIHDLAHHEVLFSFKAGDDASTFRNWWETEGIVIFAEYLRNLK